MSEMRRCPICADLMQPSFEAVVLANYSATYEQCSNCGFLRTPSPRWLDEAYHRAIGLADTGLVARNLLLASRLAAICPMLDSGGRYLDYGGGTGLLVRLMRDRGFDFWWSDRFSANVMAGGFEYIAELGPCTAVTAFEVLEHVEDPIAFVRAALNDAGADTLIFSTQLYAGAPPPRDWWYYAFEGGQHIAFYRHDTLEELGKRLGLRFLSANGIHLLTRRPISRRHFAWRVGRAGRILAGIASYRRPSLIGMDNVMLAQRAASGRDPA